MKRVINCGYKFEQRGNSYYMTSTSTHNTYKVDMEELDDNDISGYCTFQMAIVKPYDDADYAWAKYDGSTIMCFQKGKLVDYLGGFYYESDRYETFDEYCTQAMEEAFNMLEEINKTVEPRMMYN